MNTRAYSTLHLDTNLSKGTACSKKWYGCKWTQVTIDQYTYTQIKVKGQFVVRNGMDVNKDERLSNIALCNTLKWRYSL